MNHALRIARRGALAGLAGLAACTRPSATTTPTPVRVPDASLAIGACGEIGRDGVIGAHPQLERDDRDLDGDGRPEAIVMDRAMCTAEGNCYWNVFAQPPDACARYLGTFAGAAPLELLASKGDDNMNDVRAHWNLRGGRSFLHTYRFARGGYRIGDTLLCKQAADDRLECADESR
jgi:hypothetical protein